MKMRWTFLYGNSVKQRVTVTADTREEADLEARAKLDRRYEISDKEPPVAWNLSLDKAWLPHD